MAVFPRCGGIRLHALILMDWAAVAMIVAVLLAMVKIRNLVVKAKWVVAQKTFPSMPGTKLYRIFNIGSSTHIKFAP